MSSSDMSSTETGPSPTRASSISTVQVGLIAFAAYQFAIAILMVVAPHTFFTDIGPFGVQNNHYLRDTATFNAAFGAALTVAYWRMEWRTPVLCCVALQFVLHTINHLADIGSAHPSWLGPADFISLALATAVLVWLARVNATVGGTTMTRIEGVPPRKASPLVKLIYKLSQRQFGRNMDPVGVYAHAPSLLIGYGMFEQATDRQHRVEERLKVLAELKACALVNCEFCVDICSSLAREAGIGEEQMLALPHYRDSDMFDDLEKLVLDYATAMSSTPAAVSDELFTALRERFDERQLVELTNVIAIENMRARFNNAFEMTPAGFSEGMVCARFERAPGSSQNPKQAWRGALR